MIIKVYDSTQSESVGVKATNLKDLISKASSKLGFDVKKIVTTDGMIVDDDEVLEDLMSSNELKLIALKTGEKFGKGSVNSKTASRDEDEEDIEEETKPVNTNKLKDGLKNVKDDWTNVKTKEKDKTEISSGVYLERKRMMEEELEKEKKSTLKKEQRKAELEEMQKTILREREKKAELEREIERKKMATQIEKSKLKSEVAELKFDLNDIESRRKAISRMFEEFKNAEKVDLCFLVDCTGSMSSYINEAKMVIHKIVEKLNKIYKDFDLRIAFVGYRDHSDGKDRITFQDFTSKPDSFKAFVNNVKASGGDDECEDIFGGLEKVNELEWVNNTRVLFHVGDAPCHGKKFHVGADDGYPDGDPRGLKANNLLKNIHEKNITYYFAEINDSTKRMIEEFNKEFSLLHGNPVKVVKLSSAADLTATVTQSITSTIAQNKTLSMVPVKSRKLKGIEVDEKARTWSKSSMKEYKVDYLIPYIKGDVIKDIKNPDLIEFSLKPATVYIHPKPFDKGSVRFAYAAILIDGKNEKKCVVKESCFLDDKCNTMSYYKDLIESQVIADSLAEKFSEECRAEKSLTFLKASLIQKEDDGNYYTIEDYFDDSFQKWNNNAGIVNEEIYASTLDAFSHWTHSVTKEFLLVCDLQGFKKAKEYILTDPAVHSIELKRFSSTNLGKDGMVRFFETHRCNHICKDLELKKDKHMSQPDREVLDGMTKIDKSKSKK